MTGIFLYVFGYVERHSKFAEETNTKERLFVDDVSINWATNRNWHTKILHSFKVFQLKVLHQKSGKLLQEGAKPLRALNYSVARRLKDHTPALMLGTRAAHRAVE